MSPPKRTPAARSQRPGRGVTAVSQEQGRSPKLPHERDESTDAMASGSRTRIRKAHEDLRRGLQDTDRGPVLDATYRKLKK